SNMTVVLQGYSPPHALRSFPTRRSSDLRLAAKDEFTSDLAMQAGKRAMQNAGITAEQLDLLIVATVTPDMPFPSTACLLQQKLGDRKSTRLNSSHVAISYAVFCLKKKNT